jgi:hypothetical protein
MLHEPDRLDEDKEREQAERDYDPNEVMEALNSEDLIDIVWAVIEGGEPLVLALSIYKERVTPPEPDYEQIMEDRALRHGRDPEAVMWGGEDIPS